MKDLIKKLEELEATAPKLQKRKMLTEDKKPNQPGYFKDLVENMMQGQIKPIPVVGKQNDQTQTGVGFLNITDNSPAAQAMQKAVSDLVGQKKAQIVMPTDPKNAPPNAGAQGQNAVKQHQQAGMQPIQALREVGDKEKRSMTTSLGTYGKFSNTELAIDYRVDQSGEIELLHVWIQDSTGNDIIDQLTWNEVLELTKKAEEHNVEVSDDHEHDVESHLPESYFKKKGLKKLV